MTSEREPEQPGGTPTPSAADDTPTTRWSPPASVTPPPAGAPPAPATPPGASVPEHAAVSTAASTTAVARRGPGLRWGIAFLVVALVVGVAVITWALLAGSSAPSKVLGHVPGASAYMYGELRLDLPGDQRQELGEFLSKFPGFQDQSTLDVKLDDAMDRIVRAMTSDEQDWTSDIKPWFDGELGVAVLELPAPGGGPDAMPRFLILMAVKDETRARAWLDEVLTRSGATTSTADYNGATLTYTGEGSKRAAVGIAGGKVLLLGDEASVEGAVDTGGNGQIDDHARLTAAREAMDGDGLGFVFVDLERWIDSLVALAEDMEGPLPLGAADLAVVPDWLAFRVQARGDGLAFEMALPHTEAAGDLQNRTGRLAPHLPATTIALTDLHEAGPALKKAVEDTIADLEAVDPEGAADLKGGLQILGGIDGILGWMGDIGLAISRDGDQLDGGFIFSTADKARADGFFASVRNVLALAGGSMGIEVRDEDYNGTSITTIDLGSIEDLAALMGGGAPPGDVPFEGNVELSFAATTDVVVIALGDTFVKSVIDSGPGNSLADNERYKALLARVGADNTSTAFLDITAIRELLEGVLAEDAAALAEYETNYKPYITPLDAFIQASVRDGELDRSTGILVVK